jgi:hypothetical protein
MKGSWPLLAARFFSFYFKNVSKNLKQTESMPKINLFIEKKKLKMTDERFLPLLILCSSQSFHGMRPQLITRKIGLL